MIYNLVAFPFSNQNRLKVFFSQEIDLDTGLNTVNLTAVEGYGRRITASLPSTQGNLVSCLPDNRSLRGLQTCQWHGLAPNTVTPHRRLSRFEKEDYTTLHEKYSSWLDLKAKRLNTSLNEATFILSGRNTRACKLRFLSPISNYTIDGASVENPLFTRIPEGGVRELRLWSREWEKSWTVHVTWNAPAEWDNFQNRIDQIKSQRHEVRERLEGRAICLWNDDNEIGAIPALDEIKRYMPAWATVTKSGDGLLEGSKAFTI